MPRSGPNAAQWLPAARQGSREALGQALQACRNYLLLVASKELDPELQAKGGASDLVQQTFLEAQCDFARFQGSSEDELLAWLRRLLLHNLGDFTRRYRDTSKRAVSSLETEWARSRTRASSPPRTIARFTASSTAAGSTRARLSSS